MSFSSLYPKLKFSSSISYFLFTSKALLSGLSQPPASSGALKNSDILSSAAKACWTALTIPAALVSGWVNYKSRYISQS